MVRTRKEPGRANEICDRWRIYYKAPASVLVSRSTGTLPYGIVQVKGDRITRIEEAHSEKLAYSDTLGVNVRCRLLGAKEPKELPR